MSAVMFQSMPPLSPEEYAALEASIREHGIQVPILLDENGVVIDGHHRQKIAQELGVHCPRRTLFDKSDAEKRTLALTLNLDRRHLNREQRRALIAESLVADPELSNREHARRVGVSDNTVGAVRREMETSAQIAHFERRVDPRTGNLSQSASKPPVERVVVAEVAHVDLYQEPEPDRKIVLTKASDVVIDAESLQAEIEAGKIRRPVTGLDGKTYTPPTPKETTPRRTPLTDLFRTQSVNLDRCTNQMRQLSNDDRWNKNKTEIEARYGNDLRLAIEALQDIYANLTNK